MNDEVTFWLDEDGRHVWVEHKCTRPSDWPTAKAKLPLGPDGWTLVSTDPLTVTPSIRCVECDTHGFITDGRWVPA